MPFDRRLILLGALRAISAATLAGALPLRHALADESADTLPPGARSHFADINGIRMHYVRAGAGPLVLLLHGWPQTWFAWRPMIAELTSTYTVIAPDLRGCGRSERTQDGYDKKTIAADLRALISHSGFTSAHVVGHDMGGKAAYILALLHPDSVSKLVMIDCLVPGTENTDALRGGAWHYGFHMAQGFPERLTQGREREYIADQIRAWSYKKHAVSEASIDEFARHYAAPGGMTAGFNYYRALPEDAALAASLKERRLRMPVMAIAGRHSVGEKLASALAPQTDQLTSVIVEDSGHFVVEEAPDVFAAKLKSFLSS